MNEIVLVKPAYFKETGNKMTYDKNGKPNVFLQPIAGKIPNKGMVLAGTVAISNGVLFTDGALAGQLQLVLVNELESNEEFGRQFSITVLDTNVPATEVLKYRKELGEAVVVDVAQKTDAGGKTENKDVPKLNSSTTEGLENPKLELEEEKK